MSVRDIVPVDSQWDHVEAEYGGDDETLSPDELERWALNADGRPA